MSQMVAEYARRIYPCETASEVIAMHEASDQVAEMLRKPELAQAFLSATKHEEIKMGNFIVAFGKHKGKTYAEVLEDIPYVKDIFDRCQQDNYHEGFTYGEHLRHLKNYLSTIFTYVPMKKVSGRTSRSMVFRNPGHIGFLFRRVAEVTRVDQEGVEVAQPASEWIKQQDQVGEMLKRPGVLELLKVMTADTEIQMGKSLVSFGKYKGRTYAKVQEDIGYVKKIFDQCYRERMWVRKEDDPWAEMNCLKNYLDIMFIYKPERRRKNGQRSHSMVIRRRPGHIGCLIRKITNVTQGKLEPMEVTITLNEATGEATKAIEGIFEKLGQRIPSVEKQAKWASGEAAEAIWRILDHFAKSLPSFCEKQAEVTMSSDIGSGSDSDGTRTPWTPEQSVEEAIVETTEAFNGIFGRLGQRLPPVEKQAFEAAGEAKEAIKGILERLGQRIPSCEKQAEVTMSSDDGSDSDGTRTPWTPLTRRNLSPWTPEKKEEAETMKMRTGSETIKTKAQSILDDCQTIVRRLSERLSPWKVKRLSETTALGRATKLARVSGIPGHSSTYRCACGIQVTHY